MKLLRFGVVGLVLFAVLISLVLGFYTGLKDEFNFTEGDLKEGEDIGTSLNGLNIIEGINQSVSSVTTIKNPDAGLFDILGGLAAAGTGSLKFVSGIFTFPFEITAIIVSYYNIPPVITVGFLMIMVIFVTFITLSAFLRGDV